MVDFDSLNFHLRMGAALITFKKKDGSIREMEATLADYLLPEVKDPDRPKNPEVCVVFDLAKEQWRSFRYDSVLDVEYL